jgi:hypothetical protein
MPRCLGTSGQRFSRHPFPEEAMSLTNPARLAVAAAPALWFLLSAGAVAQSYPEPPQPPAEPATGGPEAVSPIHAVSLRAGPSGASPIIGTLRPGMPVEVLATASPGWLQVRSAAAEGWAWHTYLSGWISATAPAAAVATARSTGTDRSEIISP